MTQSVYELIGGADAVDAAVDLFYGKVLADKRINHYFVNTNMARQRNHQKRFLTQALGGPATYTGKAMRAAHEHLHLKEVDFNAVAENLTLTLRELNVPEHLIDQTMEIVASVKPDILNL